MRGVEQIPWLYEIICSLYEWAGLAEWRSWLVVGARSRVLDLGSGTGRNLPLLPRGTTAGALDPSLEAQARIQPLWAWAAGGCHPNRDTEAAVEDAGFFIESEGRQAKGSHRRLAARIVLSVLVAIALTLNADRVSPALAADPFADLDLIRLRQSTSAPDFTVPRLGSGSVSLKELRGQLVLLNFWATWCLPCKEEMPSMERLYQRYKDRALVILGISIDTNRPAVATFVKKLELTFPIGLDLKLDVANRYTVRALPSSFLIDRAGNTVAVALGPRDWDSAAAHAVVETLVR